VVGLEKSCGKSLEDVSRAEQGRQDVNREPDRGSGVSGRESGDELW